MDRQRHHRLVEAFFNSLPIRPRRRRLLRGAPRLQSQRRRHLNSPRLVRGEVGLRCPMGRHCHPPTHNPLAVPTTLPQNQTRPAMPPRLHHRRRRHLQHRLGHPKLTPPHANSPTLSKTTPKNVIRVAKRRNILKSLPILMGINGVLLFTLMGMVGHPIITLVCFFKWRMQNRCRLVGIRRLVTS